MMNPATTLPYIPRRVATIMLISFNVIAFLALPLIFREQYPKDVVAMGADWGPATFNGQWWRLITSSFVHFDAVHLLANMVVLYIVGIRVESCLGARELLLLYIGCGTGGDLVILSADPFSASFGASASVAGLVGAMLTMSIAGLWSKARAEKVWLTRIILAMLVGYTVALDEAGHAHWSHTASLVIGAVVTLVLIQFDPKTLLRMAVALMFALALVGTTFTVDHRFQSSWGPSSTRR